MIRHIETQMEESHAIEELITAFENHDKILELLRDIWPTIHGTDILWFQNDLFHKLRILETKCEGIGTARGFLPASFEIMIGKPDKIWKGPEEYEEAWKGLIDSCRVETDIPALEAFEDDVIGWVEDMIPIDYNFFVAALEVGTLNAEWLERAQLFLEKEIADRTQNSAVEAAATKAATNAEVQAPRHISSSRTRRRLSGLPLTPSRVRRKIRMTRRNIQK